MTLCSKEDYACVSWCLGKKEKGKKKSLSHIPVEIEWCLGEIRHVSQPPSASPEQKQARLWCQRVAGVTPENARITSLRASKQPLWLATKGGIGH